MRPRLTILLACTLCLLAAQVFAQGSTPGSTAPSLLSASLTQQGARAWGVYRTTRDEHLLVLFAPRDTGASSAQAPAEPGQIQATRPLGRRMPVSMSAMGDRVYLVYPPVYANQKRMMRVYSATASPSPVGGMWVIAPPDRLDNHDPIVTDADLVDTQASSDTLFALLNAQSGPLLLAHDSKASKTSTPDSNNDWSPIDLPEGLDAKRLDLVAIDDQLVLIDRSGTAFTGWGYDENEQRWEALPDALPMGRHTQLLAGRRAITAIDWDDEGQARVRSWSSAGVFTIASGIDIPSDARYSVLDSSETLLGIRVRSQPDQDDQPDQSADPAQRVELFELDLMNASVRFQGPPVASAPVSAEEFRFLVGMMILVMLGVLVVVILPDRTQHMHLPEHCVLADPGRRLIASMLDAIIVASIVGRFFGVSLNEILSLSVIARPDNAWAVIPATIIVGIAYATLFEWLLSATPGKLVTAIRVARAEQGQRARPMLWSALVRNIIKWALPPLAALALVDRETLHRGDRASSALVVMPRPDDPVPDDQDQQ